MLNNFSPLPLKKLPLLKNILPLNIEPLFSDFTTNPNLSLTDAVTEPEAIRLDTNASGVNADLGILNNPSPLPEKNEPLYKNMLEVN